MTLLVLGIVIFLGLHSVQIVAPGWRRARIERMGEKRWKGLYSVMAAVGLVLIVVGYGLARRDAATLYVPPTGLRHVALLLMVPVFPLLIAAYAPGRIQRAAKHPMLLAVKFWATAHLLANGSTADVLLFGAFLVWAVADRVSVKRRPSPLASPPRGAAPGLANDAVVVVGGLALYVLTLVWLHRWVIGVSPIG